VVLDCLQGGRNAWPEWGYKFKGGMVWNHVTPGMPWCSRLAVVASQIFFWEEKATVEDWAINTLSLSVSVQDIYALKILDLQLSGKYVADKAKLSCRALKFLQLMAPKLWLISICYNWTEMHVFNHVQDDLPSQVSGILLCDCWVCPF
jgi:hypothetical protein